MITLIDNPVELVGLIKPIEGYLEGVYKTRGSVILNRSTNLSTK